MLIIEKKQSGQTHIRGQRSVLLQNVISQLLMDRFSKFQVWELHMMDRGGYQLRTGWALIYWRPEASSTPERHISAPDGQIFKFPSLGASYDG